MTNPAELIGDSIAHLLKTPVGDVDFEPEMGFEALEKDGSTKLGLSEQVLAAMARAALTKWLDGIVFNDITAHRDGDGQLMRVEVEYMDEVHDPSARKVVVAYP